MRPRGRRLPGPEWLRVLLRTRLVPLGLLIVLVILLLALTADFLTPYDPDEQHYSDVLKPPSAEYPLGTDDLGRDVYSRIAYGSRISLEVGVIAVSIGVVLGTLVGLCGGYYGGLIEDVLMRTMDAVRAFPALVLALSINAVLGPGIVNVMVAVGVVSVPSFARLAHGQVLSVREREYVTAARVSGVGPWRIMLVHILPNIASPIIVQASLGAAFAILAEAALSFLGLGVRPPTPSWGSLLRAGYQYLNVAPWLALVPGAAIFLAVLAFNLIGDGLRQALDPRLKERGVA
ncbi:MAG: ABC transporter permease [Chloroflexi bacterium]|nr:ABC transporter permease [Chloroflexota bacterium]